VLTISTNEATNNVHTINLREEIHGSILAWGSGAVDSSLGGIYPGGVLTENFTVTNNGDAATTFSLTSGDPNFVISKGTATDGGNATTDIPITAGQTIHRTLTFTAPTAQGTYSSIIAMTAGANNCATAPGSWTVHAVSLNGYPTLEPTPNTLNFTQACGALPASQTVTLTNSGTAPLSWTQALQTPGTCFSVVPSRTDNPLPVGQSVVLTISPLAAFAADDQTGCQNRLDLTFNTASGTYVDHYPLVATPLGASLVFSQGVSFTELFTSPPQPVDSRTFTVTNNGNQDPLETNSDAHLTLSISNGQFSFSSSISQTTMTLIVPANGVAQPVTVYYLTPLTGAAESGETGNLTWTMGEGDKSCTCGGSSPGLVACGAAVTTGTLSGYFHGVVHAGSLSVSFQSDFGTIFCGATANTRTLQVSNTGTGDVQITNPTTGTSYFSVGTITGLDGNVLHPSTAATFQIVPSMINPADVTGAADLLGTASKFSGTLHLTTTAPNQTDVAVPLVMHAQGVMINTIESSDWTYPTITWPTGTSSIDHKWVDNQGNWTAVASIPDANSDKFSLVGTSQDVAPSSGGVPSQLNSTFGSFARCDSVTQAELSYDNTGTLTIVAKLPAATGQVYGSAVGICGTSDKVSTTTGSVCGSNATSCAVWKQALGLHGVVLKASDMCPAANGIMCNTGTGLCNCNIGSCGTIGCCTETVQGLCIPFANQSANMDQTGNGCGTFVGGSDGLCGACATTGLSGAPSCVQGVCQGSCSEGNRDCDDNMRNGCEINITTNADNCGGCGAACSGANISNRTCSGGACNGDCAPGFSDCDTNKRTNGCEIQINGNDNNNCGACNAACSAGNTTCQTGSCICDQNACGNGCCTARSNGTCVLYADQGPHPVQVNLPAPAVSSLCGNSGSLCGACPSDQECAPAGSLGGVCQCDATSCPSGCCDSNGACQAYGTVANCAQGAAGAACPGSFNDCSTIYLTHPACISGSSQTCGCSASYPDSCPVGDGTYNCYDTQTDNAHCGSCTTVCAQNQQCNFGLCGNGGG
jgi:hypothetical protein